ncbi:hypothetical protein PROFUN_10057 [Planoprotostelium fungivorum]|uniref:glutathione gamma-glutamylcysteinyltransferase n=1 Tax=Planoprotostelium fungivorum TaxID=1890364 RepID=A0A2P6NFF4_9EUKA|nr:hypothetical protein PROFUN_10057 [Planoprotostelium fungivorum]
MDMTILKETSQLPFSHIFIANQWLAILSAEKQASIHRSTQRKPSPMTSNQESATNVEAQPVDPDTLNLRQLRIELKRFGLSPSGSKADLIKRYKLATGVIDAKTVAEDANKVQSKSILKGRKDTAIHPDMKASKRKTKPPSKLLMTTSSILDAEDDHLSHSDEDYEIEEDEGWKTFANFYNKRKSAGLDNDEIERRKRLKLALAEEESYKHPTEYPPEYNSDDPSTKPSIPSPKNQSKGLNAAQKSQLKSLKEAEALDNHLLDVTQMRFFDHAALELERIKMQEEYDTEISKLEGQVEGMKREIKAKDNIIEALRTGIFSGSAVRSTIPAVTAPVQETVYNWMAIQRLMGEFADHKRMMLATRWSKNYLQKCLSRSIQQAGSEPAFSITKRCVVVRDMSPSPSPIQTPVQPSSFYKRPLPNHLVPFSSPEALDTGSMESYWTLAEQFHTQSEPAYCGLATLTMVLNALQIDPNRLWKGPWRWYNEDLLDCCTPLEREGITMNNFACLAKCNGADVEVVKAENSTLSDFRERIKAVCNKQDEYIVVSFSRNILGQTGHFSAISAYHEGKDMVLVMDTAKFKYPAFWCPVTMLYEAMLPKDRVTNLSRGYFVLRRSNQRAIPHMHTHKDPSHSESQRDLDLQRCWSMLSHYLTHRLPVVLREMKPKVVGDVVYHTLKYLPKNSEMLLRSFETTGQRETLESQLCGTKMYSVINEIYQESPGLCDLNAEMATLLIISAPSQLYREVPPEVKNRLSELRDIDTLPIELSQQVIQLRHQMLNFAWQCGCKREDLIEETIPSSRELLYVTMNSEGQPSTGTLSVVEEEPTSSDVHTDASSGDTHTEEAKEDLLTERYSSEGREGSELSAEATVEDANSENVEGIAKGEASDPTPAQIDQAAEQSHEIVNSASAESNKEETIQDAAHESTKDTEDISQESSDHVTDVPQEAESRPTTPEIEKEDTGSVEGSADVVRDNDPSVSNTEPNTKERVSPLTSPTMTEDHPEIDLTRAGTRDEIREMKETLLMEEGEKTQHHLTKRDVIRIYQAKCKDLGITPNSLRESRFTAILNKNCSGHTFNMKDTGLGELAGTVIADILAPDTFYTQLLLAGNSFRDSGAVAIAQMLKINRTITDLDLRSNDIDLAGGNALFKELADNTTLKSLDLSGMSGVNRNHIGRSGAEMLKEALKKNRTLEQLMLRENGFGSEGAAVVAQGLKVSSPSDTRPHLCKVNYGLRTLDMGANNIGSEGCKAIAEGVLMSVIQHLHLSRNNITDSGAHAIAEILQGSRRLVSVDLSGNRIGPSGGKHIGEAIKDNRSLEYLNLDKNELGATGIRVMAESLKDNVTLKTLLLTHNRIDSKGGVEMAEALRSNRGLTKLDLSSNYLGDTGATAFASSIRFNIDLAYLDLSNNKIGGAELAATLQNNQTLRYFYLKNNSMSETTGEAFSLFLKNNTYLLGIDITFNDFNYRHIDLVEKRVKENLRAYRGAAIDRYQREIEVLQSDKNRLIHAESQLEKEKEMLQGMEKRMEERLQTLERTEADEKERIREMKETLLETTKLISKTEAKQMALSHEASKIRSDKDARYWALIQKLHKEKDNNARLEKRIRAKKQQVEEQKQKNDKEIQGLEEQLRIRQFDKSQSEEDLMKVQDEVTRLRALLDVSTMQQTVELHNGAPAAQNNATQQKQTRFPALKSR